MTQLFPLRVFDANNNDRVQEPAIDAWFFEDDNLIIPQANYLVTLNSPVATETVLK